jgi:hypothetical protein
MTLAESERLFTVNIKAVVCIAKIPMLCGRIPESFHHCCYCGKPEPSTHILCALTEDETLIRMAAEPWLADPTSDILIKSMRRAFGTNCEFPVCEAHRRSMVIGPQ